MKIDICKNRDADKYNIHLFDSHQYAQLPSIVLIRYDDGEHCFGCKTTSYKNRKFQLFEHKACRQPTISLADERNLSWNEEWFGAWSDEQRDICVYLCFG